jgi:antitoxin CptB
MIEEDREHRLKRLAIRSWRRGTKEMDLILGRFWDENGASLDAATLELYEALLAENDQDLYLWVSGQSPAPDRFAPLIERLAP